MLSYSISSYPMLSYLSLHYLALFSLPTTYIGSVILLSYLILYYTIMSAATAEDMGMEQMIQLDLKYQSRTLEAEREAQISKCSEVSAKLEQNLDKSTTLLIKLSTDLSLKDLMDLEPHTIAIKIDKSATIATLKEKIRDKLKLRKEVAENLQIFGYNEEDGNLKNNEIIEKTLLIECITDKNMKLKLPKPYGGVAWISF